MAIPASAKAATGEAVFDGSDLTVSFTQKEIKEAFTGWYEGKSVEETVKEMRNSAIGEAVKIGTGKLIEKGVKSVNAGYQGSGYVYGSMYREGVEGAITKNIELGQQLSETFNTGFDVTMTWIKD